MENHGIAPAYLQKALGHGKRTALFFIATLLFGLVLASDSWAQSDLYASVTQQAANKVLSDPKYPLNIINQSYPPCVSGLSQISAEGVPEYSPQGMKDLLAWAANRKPILPFETETDNIASRIDDAHKSFVGMLAQVDAQRTQAGTNWKGPSQADVAALRARDWIKLQACLAWLSVDLNSKPSVQLSGSTIPISGIDTSIGATGVLYGYWPDFICDNYCIDHICCWGHFENHWHYIGSLTVKGVKFTASGKVLPEVDGLIINLTATVDRLRLNYPILDQIPLEGFANDALSGKKIQVIDASKLVASFPYLNTSYQIAWIKLSGTGELRVDIAIKKLP
jgi:hypothetical protein